ncbi:ArnT family glycosyltransferase [Pyrococcus kukulkanii]|uniref:ArnT family glycosyltransferase n=1 Tax=Pyrococcus kukulkanii TaxID=1609559 RepID=UPI003566D41A
MVWRLNQRSYSVAVLHVQWPRAHDGGRELVHSEFTFFYTLAIYFLYTGRKRGEPRRIYLAFISAGLAVLTRYTGLSIIPVFLAYLWLTDYRGRVKKKEYRISFMLFFLVLLPWLYLGHLHYGGYFRPFKIANRVVTLDKPVSVSDFLKLLLNDIGIVLPVLAVLGFLKHRQDEKGYLLIGWSFIGFIMIMISPVIGILTAEDIELIGKTIEIVTARVGMRNVKPWLLTSFPPGRARLSKEKCNPNSSNPPHNSRCSEGF